MRRPHILIIVVLMLAVVQQHSPATENPTSSFREAIERVDPSLALSIPAAMAGTQKKQITLIDVRPVGEYTAYHIPGSLNIAAHAIKTKTYLKGSTLALVNNGYALSELVPICRDLNTAGFTAKILEGGILAWKTKGGDLVGDPFQMTAVNRVPARLFDREVSNPNYLFVDASPQGQGRVDGGEWAFPVVRLPLLEQEQAVAELKKLRAKGMSQSFFTILVFTTNGEENGRLQRLLEAEGLPQVFFLEGGLQAFSKHKQFQTLAQKSKGDRLVQTTGSGCAACSEQ